MKRLLALALAAAPCFLASPAHAMTVDEIVARNLQVTREVEDIVTGQVRPLDDELRRRKLEPIPTSGGEQAEGDEPADGAAVAAVSRCLVSRGASCEDAVQAARRAERSRGEKD